MIFKHTLEQVLNGTKTQTRRPIKKKHGDTPPWRPGRTYAVQPDYGKKAVARFEALSVKRERLGDITDADAKAEGFSDREIFLQEWFGRYSKDTPNTEVWAIGFKLTEIFESEMRH